MKNQTIFIKNPFITLDHTRFQILEDGGDSDVGDIVMLVAL